MELGEEHQLDAAWLDDIIYLGPEDAADRVATMHAVHKRQIPELPSRQRSRWLQKQPSNWPRLTSPAKLLVDLEMELGYGIVGKENVVHDLWPARTLPPLPLFERLELLLAGYDLTFKFNVRGGATIVKMPTAPRAEWDVEIPAQYRSTVRGLLKDHESATLDKTGLISSWRIRELIRKTLEPPRSVNNRDRIRYTLRAENQPIGPFVRSLCKQLDLECEFTDSANPELNKRISFQVDEVDVQTLFREVLASAGLECSLEGNRLRVSKSREENP